MAVALALAFGCGDKFYVAEQLGNGGEGGAPETAAGGEADSGSVMAGGSPDKAGSESGGSAGTGGIGGGGGRPGGGSGGQADNAGAGALAGSGVGGVPTVGGVGGSGGMPLNELPVPALGLELWFDAQHGITQADGGVSLWKDRSPFARDANQGTASLRPTLVAQGLNGKPSVVFDGTDDYLDVPTLTGNFSAGIAIFLVGQTESSDHCMAYFEMCNGTEVDDVHLGFWEARYLYEVADPYLSVQMGQVLATPELLVAVQEPSEDVKFRRNGVLVGDSKFALPVVKPRQRVYLGKTEYGGCTTLSGRISEMLLYSRAVSAEEQQQVEAYLQQKWACCGP